MGFVTSLFARKMVAAAGDGVDAADLLAAAGIDPDGPWDPRAMIPEAAYYDMLERMAARTDVTDLPLRVGASMRCDEYGALGLAWKAAPDLHRSFGRVARYARLWTSIAGYELRPAEDGVLFVEHREGARRLGLRLSVEADLASGIALSRQTTGAHVVPTEVFFRHPGPATTQAHEAYFGCPVRFDAGMDAMHLSAATLACANRLGDEGISRYLTAHLDRELSEIADEAPLVARAKEAVAQALSEGAPKMPEIARHLGLSARSFHRRLSDHGVSFQTLTAQTRRDLAVGLLRDDRHSLAEIAFLTGFAEQSSFTRAFKRWVGETPASYRKGRAGL